MKFILGFFIGLLTGVTIILGPLIVVFVSLGLSNSADDEETLDLPVPTHGHVTYQSMRPPEPHTVEEPPS
jgi:hypothetical protein